MKDYKGIIKLHCGKDKCIKRGKMSMEPLCMKCPHNSAKIVDLNDKLLFAFNKVTVKKKKNNNK